MVKFLHPILRDRTILDRYPVEVVELTRTGSSVNSITADMVIPGIGFISALLRFSGHRFSLDVSVSRLCVKEIVESRIYDLITRYKSPDYTLTELNIRLDKENDTFSSGTDRDNSGRWLNIIRPSSFPHAGTFA